MEIEAAPPEAEILPSAQLSDELNHPAPLAARSRSPRDLKICYPSQHSALGQVDHVYQPTRVRPFARKQEVLGLVDGQALLVELRQSPWPSACSWSSKCFPRCCPPEFLFSCFHPITLPQKAFSRSSRPVDSESSGSDAASQSVHDRASR